MQPSLILAAQQKRAVRRYREAGATSPDRARSPEELGVSGRFALRALVRRGVLVDAGEGRFYLDRERAQTVTAQRRGLVILLGALLLFGFLAAYALGLL